MSMWRIDPYWDPIWGGRSYPMPWPAPPPLGGPKQTAAIEKLLRKPLPLVKALGALHAYRTMTTPQWAAFTGMPALANPGSTLVTALREAGLVEISTAAIARSGVASRSWTESSNGQPHERSPLLVRLRDSDAFAELVVPRLTWPEWVGVTGGQDRLNLGRQSERHNVLAAELALRFAEYAHVGTVLGEAFSTFHLLFEPGVDLTKQGKARAIQLQQAAADLTLVLPGGPRIAVEVTCNVNRSFGAKVERWARELEKFPSPLPNVSVVFLIAPSNADRDRRQIRQITRVARNEIEAACARHTGTSLNRTRERISVAHWTDWFPAEHQLSDDFLLLTASRPPVDPGSAWRPTELIRTEVDATFGVPGDLRAVIDNAGLLGQTPSWLRAPTSPPDLADVLIADAGWTRLPHPSPAHPTRPPKGRVLGAASGAVRGTQTPRRLRGLAVEANALGSGEPPSP
ncbi:hypothetical protein [Marmoricola sp. RAF53]|uniref:hypothetical protein n=1 Tax=Marmoricola sp. RAF53 TaxID=3233059 RepID=UPI003F9D61AD